MQNPKRALSRLFSIGVSALALSLFSPFALAALTQSKIDVKSGVWPVMVRIDYNPILEIAVEEGEGEPLESIKLDFSKTTVVADIDCVEVYLGGNVRTAGTLFGKAKPTKTNPIVTVKSAKPTPLPAPAKNAKASSIWVSVKMKKDADITGTVACTASQMVIKKKPYVVNSVSASQRVGYAVAKAGDFGSKFYRIPAITRTKKGSLVATFDIRYNSSGDLPGKIDVGVSRSTDGGQTWSPVESVLSSAGLNIGNGVGDPGILSDLETGEVWISALGAPESGHPIFSTITGTTDAKKCGQMFLLSSKDDGKTWSKKATNITADIKRLNDPDTQNWGMIFQGPGAGISLKDGTLVFPAQVWGNRGKGTWGVLVYSKDHGKTWTSSKAFPWGGSESTCVELKDGSVMLNVRQGSPGARIVATTKDLGETWTKFEGEKLRQPGNLCQAALLISKNKRDLYFSNPNSGTRDRMTLKYSKDGGKKWTKGLLYDDRKCAGYSTLAFADDSDSRIGVLYEGAGKVDALYLFYLSIPVSEIQRAK